MGYVFMDGLCQCLRDARGMSAKDGMDPFGGMETKINTKRVAAALSAVFLAQLLGVAPAVASDAEGVSDQGSTDVVIVGELIVPEEFSIDDVVVSDEVSETAFVGDDTSGANVGALAEPVDGAYRVVSTWKDYSGRAIAARQGTLTWGVTHYQSKHNLTTRAVRAATQNAFQRIEESASSVVYRAKVNRVQCSNLGVCSVKESKVLRVVVNPKVLSDKKPRGVISAYCEGVAVCPDWVKNAANI